MTTALAIGLTLATTQVTDIRLYSGQPAEPNGYVLSAWGGGTITDSNEVVETSARSLKITTSTFAQGGVMKLPRAVNLASEAKNPENMLGVHVYVVGETSQPSGDRTKRMENMRIVIRTSDGKLSEAVLNFYSPSGFTNRWRRAGIPLQKIPGFMRTNQEVEAIMFAGDAPATFYVSEVRIVTDQTPIQGTLSHRDINVGFGQELALYALAEAGYTQLEYSWDFNDKDGIQEDASGQVVFHKFRIPGEFNITCTIRDKYGLKQPWVGKIAVTVNP